MKTIDLFSPENLAATVVIPPAPKLVPHKNLLDPMVLDEDSARWCLALSREHSDMLAAVIKSQGGAELTKQQVLALVPKDWRDLLGRFAHGSLGWQEGEKRGIRSKYVAHDDGGFHFTFQAVGLELTA